MSQQYVLLRKENYLLDSLIGQSFNQKSKFEADKILDEIHSKAESRMIGKKALCYIVDKNEILGVGGSTLMKNKKSGEIVSNLILNQFGKMLAVLFKGSTVLTASTVLTSTVGGSETVNIYGAAGFNASILNFGVLFQVGSGITVPARTDFFIETIFGTAPENFRFSPITTPIFNSALGNFKQNASIIAGGAGTINESILEMNWNNSAAVLKTFTLFRDIISPGQSFIAGQSIALEYTIQL